MVLQEMEAMGFLTKENYKIKINSWKEMFKSVMSTCTKYKMIPIFMNTYDEIKIKDLINKGDQCKALFLDNNIQKNGKFFTAVKIFEYPNRILSIRIILVSFYKTKIRKNTDDVFQLTD